MRARRPARYQCQDHDRGLQLLHLAGETGTARLFLIQLTLQHGLVSLHHGDVTRSSQAEYERAKKLLTDNFETLKRMGYGWARDLHHLAYGMVNLPSGKMKTREGTVVDADDQVAVRQLLEGESSADSWGRVTASHCCGLRPPRMLPEIISSARLYRHPESDSALRQQTQHARSQDQAHRLRHGGAWNDDRVRA